MFEDNIKTYLKGVGWGDVDWVYLTQDRLKWRAVLKTVTNRRIP